MNYVIISIIFISFVLSFLHNLHIYQLNYYKSEVQRKWLFNNQTLIAINISLSLLQVILIIVSENVFLLTIGILQIIYNIPRRAKKKLVFTPRAVRITVEALILFILTMAFAFIFSPNYYYLYGYIFLILTPFILLFVDYTQKPLNKFINNQFINDAKRILQASPELIVIGITGSYGKTSMKYFLTEFLSTKYSVLKTPGNYNTTLGVVRTIREQLKSTHEIFVCEMGATKPNDIKEICNLVNPKHAIITSVGPQHLESFKTIENVIRTKFELADALPKEGMLFLNYDNEYIKKEKRKGNIYTYGSKNENVNYQAKDIKVNENGLSFVVNKVKFTTKLIGEHNVTNIVGALAVASEMGIKLKDLVEVVRRLEPVPHRLELKKQGNRLIIDDAYNSNPLGASSALDALSQFAEKKVIMTPGMVELGTKEDEYNYEFGKQIAKVCDYVLLVNEKQTKSIYKGLIDSKYSKDKIFICQDIQEAFKKLTEIEKNDKIVLLIENDLPDQY